MTWSLQSHVNYRANSSVEFEGSVYSATEYRIAVLENWAIFHLLLVNFVIHTKLLFFCWKSNKNFAVLIHKPPADPYYWVKGPPGFTILITGIWKRNDRKVYFSLVCLIAYLFLEYENGKKTQKLENKIAISLDKIEKTWSIPSLLLREINFELHSHLLLFQIPQSWSCLLLHLVILEKLSWWMSQHFAVFRKLISILSPQLPSSRYFMGSSCSSNILLTHAPCKRCFSTV